MRIRYIISYDISDKVRWRRVYRIMRGYGDHMHFSVFRADMSDSERVLLVEALNAEIDHKKDRVMFVSVGRARGRGKTAIESMGRAVEAGTEERQVVIV